MLEFIQMRISNKHKDFIGILISLIYIPEILILKIIADIKYKSKKNVWIISERGIEAKDNGHHFFKYLKENNLKEDVYYIMDKNNINDYSKISSLGNIVQYRSFKHKILYIKSSALISTHMNTIIPWRYCRYKQFNKIYKWIIGYKKFIFLQHGIIRGDLSKSLGKNSSDIDLFITSAKPEYEYVKKFFGYNQGEVVYTGLARFDKLHDINCKNILLVMPSWRVELRGVNHDEFKKSSYYKIYNNLINNKLLLDILNKYNYKLIFYPHHEMQRYLHLYTLNDNIILANNKEFDVQKLLKESKLLITDYSSVFFDFAYMDKPVIYYHSEKDENINKGLKESYFKYKENGFGPIKTNENELVEYIEELIINNFDYNDKYKERIKDFFYIRDDKNCDRIYKEILNII